MAKLKFKKEKGIFRGFTGGLLIGLIWVVCVTASSFLIYGIYKAICFVSNFIF